MEYFVAFYVDFYVKFKSIYYLIKERNDLDSNLDTYLFQPKKIEDIINTALVVVDTNVLLAGYQYRDITLKEIMDTLSALKEKERLIIPSHVLKEFFNRRPSKIVELIQSVQQHRDSIQSLGEWKRVDKKVPSLDYTTLDENITQIENDLIESRKDYNKKIGEYRDSLTALIDELKTYFNIDPILENYKEIFKSAFYMPETLPSEGELLEKFKERVKKKLPPGYKDAGKEDNEAGDYIIWAQILSLKEDVLFISADNKPDWVYKEPGGKKIISARRELVEEFYAASEGKTFCIVHPSTFIQLYNPDVKEDVIEDLSNTDISVDLIENNDVEEVDPLKDWEERRINCTHDYETEKGFWKSSGYGGGLSWHYRCKKCGVLYDTGEFYD